MISANPPQSELKRAIVYIRVSTKEQVDEGNSLATQERLCRDYAKKQGITVKEEGIFREEGESAKTANRTVLKKMITYASLHKNEIDCLLIYRIDRLARETRDYSHLKGFFGSLGIRVISISENFEDDPVGRFIENTLAGVAQLDNEIRAERSKNGMVDAVREGRWVWKAPLGYINARVHGKKNIKPNPAGNTVTLLREAWELVDSGFSIEATRRIMEKKGLVSERGKAVSKSQFQKLFHHPIYKGVIDKFGLTILSDAIEPIVPPELFDRVHLKLTGAYHFPEKYLKANPEFPLRGVMFCKYGHRMTASAPRGNGGRYPKYHCHLCRGVGTSHNKTTVETRFKTYINYMSYPGELKEGLVVAIMGNWEQEQQVNRKQIAKLKKRLLELDAEDNEIGRKNIAGVFSDEHAKKMLAANSLERTKINLELSGYDYLDQDLEEMIEDGASSLEDISALWEGLEDIHIKQRFQKWLFPLGVVYDGEKFGTSQLPLCISIKKDLSNEKSLLVDPTGFEPVASSVQTRRSTK